MKIRSLVALLGALAVAVPCAAELLVAPMPGPILTAVLTANIGSRHRPVEACERQAAPNFSKNNALGKIR
jgi:hypothetical protein